MLRSRAAAKHRRSGLRSRPPPSPAPSRRAPHTATVAAAAPESKRVPVLEDPLLSSMEEASFTFELRRGSKRAKQTIPPAQVHRGKDNSREALANKTNVVPTKERPEQRHLSVGTQARDASSEDRDQPCSRSADDLPELKDVFEVTEMEKEESCPGSDKADLEFVRQKFLDAKRLSTDEAHRNSKEFGEALEILYSKKDVFLEILEENSGALSGFPGHIFGHSASQCPPLKSETATTKLFEQDNHCSMEVKRDSLFNVPKESQNPIPSIHLNESCAVPLEPLLAPKGRKSKGSGRRSQIVVLKPNLQRESFTPVLSSKETLHFGQQSIHNCSKPQRHNTYSQQVMHSMPFDYDQSVEPKGDAPQQNGTKQTSKFGSRRKPSEKMCQLEIGSERAKASPGSFEDNMSIFPSNLSVGSSVCRKARKHLSERWQMAYQSDAEISMPTDTITLGEMLELSYRDATKVNICENSTETNYNHDSEQKAPTSPAGISSKDGWKTGIYCKDEPRGVTSRSFSRSKSVPASATNGAKLSGRKQHAPTCNLPILKDILNAPTDECGSEHVRNNRSPFRKSKQKNGIVFFPAGKENMLPEKEIHVTSERARHSICTSDLSRASNTHNEHPGGVISNRDHQISGSTVLDKDEQNSKGEMGWTEQKLTPPSLEAKEDASIRNQDDIALKEQEGRSQSLEIDITEVDPQATQSSHTVSLENRRCSNTTASLEQICGHETAYSGIFEGISDGIQQLRLQLKMLKMDDQDDTCADDLYMFSSEDCNDMDILTYQAMDEQLPGFKDEDDRDFTYTNDMLGATFDLLIYPEDWQVSSNVFVWLEDKYGKLPLWLKSDRRLLFDLINSILADMTALGHSLHSNMMLKCWPEMDQRKLAEIVWQTVLQRRSHQPFSLDCIEALPLDHRSELEATETEIVEMMLDNILEESVAEFVSQQSCFSIR
ncbi:hypothetical protein GUJ93_ZPchr0010g7260 [Zizania palustris]|uniref:DUF4378 domain-containing protein n=1 Tax=Zizania palustris TaxID=103762 RepID=A0A8J5W812_ZIZPA|nr:hypothetical protein GUJ93_ZPchr0010g7260 [Zizania palustris]